MREGGKPFLLLWHRTAEYDPDADMMPFAFGTRRPVVNSECAFVPANKREKTTTCRPSFTRALSNRPGKKKTDGGEERISLILQFCPPSFPPPFRP